MKIKVELGANKLVIPLSEKELNGKVEALYPLIVSRFQKRGIGGKDLRIASLQTSDGFSIDSSDIVKQVIDNGEVLVALDYATWLKAQEPLCKTEWMCLIQEDFVDDEYKYVIVGLHEYNQLFIKFGTGWPTGKSNSVLRLEIFDVDSLQNFGKNGKVFIGSGSPNASKWKAEAYLHVNTNGIATHVEISVQAASDSRPVIKKLPISITPDTKQITKGEETLVQGDIAFENVKVAIPNFKKTQTGPSLPSNDSFPKDPEPKGNKAVGNPNLEITQEGKLEPDQTYASDGKFAQRVFATFSILNKSKEEISIRSVSSKYLNSMKEWVDAETYTGSRSGFYNYHFNPSQDIIKIGGENQIKLSTSTVIHIQAPQFEKMRRVHKSLPNPLEIQITFEEVNGTKSVINVKNYNPPYNLITKEYAQTQWSMPAEFWIQCDDVELETRTFAVLSLDPDKTRLEISSGERNKNRYLYRNHLKKFAWQATQENKTEIEITDLNFESSGISSRVFALVDKATKKCYALRFELKTTTSSATDYYVIPPLNPSK